jgi:hypothetical protein
MAWSDGSMRQALGGRPTVDAENRGQTWSVNLAEPT